MNKNLMTSAATAVLLGFMAIGAHAQNVAIVNGKAVPKTRLNALAAQLERAGKQVGPEMEEQLREEVIAREIFAQEAQKRGMDGNEEFKFQMELARQSLLIRELFNDFQKNVVVNDSEAKAEYDRYMASNGDGKEYHSRHILVEKEEQAKAIIASLKKGGKFEEIAKKQSKDPGSGANGGDLQWANANSFVKEFSDAMVALKKGQITETPVKTQFGFHVIRLDDVREVPGPKFEEVKPQIVQQLQQNKLIDFQKSLRDKAKIE
jgi:peptidyl-prolyl cis-trans isomerase C